MNHLHPAAHRGFFSKLLARSVADSIYSIRREGTHSTIRPFEATDNYLEFVGELSFSVFKDMGYEKVLLVEGVEDVLTVQQFLRRFNKDHRVVVIPLGGRQLICAGRDKEIQELLRVSNDVSALIDSERKAEGDDLEQDRTAFVETCNKAGVKICITSRRAIENYFPDRAVKLALGQEHTALEPFEVLKGHANAWHKRDNWRIASHMTEEELVSSDLGQFLRDL